MNPVKIVLVIAIAIIGLSGIAQVFIECGSLHEPTHSMTDEEMMQVCIEEGIL